VLLDSVDADGTAVARHAGQAPVVDGVTYVESCQASCGEFVNVRCNARQDYDLLAKPTEVALTVVST